MRIIRDVEASLLGKAGARTSTSLIQRYCSTSCHACVLTFDPVLTLGAIHELWHDTIERLWSPITFGKYLTYLAPENEPGTTSQRTEPLPPGLEFKPVHEADIAEVRAESAFSALNHLGSCPRVRFSVRARSHSGSHVFRSATQAGVPSFADPLLNSDI